MRLRPADERIATGTTSLHAYAVTRSVIPFAWHRHPECELTSVRRGRGLRYVGDAVEPFGVDDVVLIGANVPHTWAASAGRFRVAVVQFRPEVLLAAGAPPELAGLRTLLADAGRGLALPEPGSGLGDDLERLAAERDPLARFGMLCGLLARFRAAGPRPLALDAPARVDDGAMGRVLAHIDAHAAQPIAIARLAALAGMGVPGFCRAFRRSMGRTCTDYIAEVRIGRACRMLLEDDRAVTAIAHACGFASLASFNRWFRRLRGVPPTRWRQQARAPCALPLSE
jgi:AraC-like DNA-binding protein